MRKRFGDYLPALFPLVSLCGWLIGYQWVTSNSVDLFFQFSQLPTLTEIVRRIPQLLTEESLITDMALSITRVVSGFVLACCLAIPLAVAMTLNKPLQIALLPLLEMLRPIPNVAWVPVAILLLPKASMSILFITTIGAFFPVLLNTMRGARGIEPQFHQNSANLQLTKLEHVRYVLLPGSAPLILTGAVIGMGTAWLGVIVAESTYGAQGIGYFTYKSLQLIDYPAMLVGMFCIGLLGSLSTACIKSLGKKVIVWENQLDN